MDKEYIIAFIGIAGTLAGTVFGFALTIIYDSVKKSQHMKDELQKSINRAQLVATINKYPIALTHLRNVIQDNAHILIKNKPVVEFYSKWLSDPTLSLESEFIGFYTPEKIQELRNDLSKLKI